MNRHIDLNTIMVFPLLLNPTITDSDQTVHIYTIFVDYRYNVVK